MEIRDFLLLAHLATGASPSVAQRLLLAIARGAAIEHTTLYQAIPQSGRAKVRARVATPEFTDLLTQATAGDFIAYTDDAYPNRLRAIPQPPLVLFYAGQIALLQQLNLAVVGARAASEYTSAALARIIPGLDRQVAVVSGLARGADGTAHRLALQNGNPAIGVLASGLDIAYPRRNAALQERVGQQGLLLSEYPPTTAPRPFRFVARNRIIAGICHGLLVTEAAHHSGSLITATMALDNGREVFALPNRIDAPLGIGTNEILAAGATMALDGGAIMSSLHLFA